jgi:8-oxo-dGTP diphosphatase
MNKPIQVACAVIIINDRYLAVQRSEKMNLPLKWEFPGGKLEPNETVEQCIKREIKEELNIEITLVQQLTRTSFNYPNIDVVLIPYLATLESGNLTLKEHKQYRLLTKEELNSIDWAEADLPIVNEIQHL